MLKASRVKYEAHKVRGGFVALVVQRDGRWYGKHRYKSMPRIMFKSWPLLEVHHCVTPKLGFCLNPAKSEMVSAIFAFLNLCEVFQLFIFNSLHVVLFPFMHSKNIWASEVLFFVSFISWSLVADCSLISIACPYKSLMPIRPAEVIRNSCLFLLELLWRTIMSEIFLP